ncbi:protein-glutamate O-methyltransferase CheR [Sphingomonas sp.]|uniref:CheR family methyltransferase n=1 Tax=Sphingomonas sp. TaxID=28214 RepID=UPI002C769F99|nr:protein-glutamate O-methyltransferase CheR [Sphingomonas sp.]HTG37903.1 protein-glutamate O-methyltransferase CheR [Sphingomonas sp.]
MMALRQEAVPRPAATNVIATLLEKRTGQQLQANRAWRIDSTLTPVLQARGLPDFDALALALAQGRDGALADAVIEALLNHETSFFRDPGVLEQALSALAARDRPIRIWSAGCATGQEPLSLAMLFAERGVPVEIHATDVSSAAIARARAGRYSQFEVQRGLPIGRLVRWFEPTGDDWCVRADLNERIRYRRHNLAGDPVLPGGFDMILCRNVLMYFGLPMRRRVLDGLSDALRPGGLVLLGAGETVIGQSERLAPCREWRGFYAVV